jgi:hypothetical protein
VTPVVIPLVIYVRERRRRPPRPQPIA